MLRFVPQQICTGIGHAAAVESIRNLNMLIFAGAQTMESLCRLVLRCADVLQFKLLRWQSIGYKTERLQEMEFSILTFSSQDFIVRARTLPI